MSGLRDSLRQEQDTPSIADEVLLEALTGDTRAAFIRFVRQEIEEAFWEGFSEGEVYAGGRADMTDHEGRTKTVRT